MLWKIRSKNFFLGRGSWVKPETTASGYDDIVISENDEESLRVIAEFVAVL
jgi:hypothetical protein